MFIGLCLILSLCTCNKEEKTQTKFHDSTAVLQNSDAKGNNYSIVIAVGHHISDCGGRCVRMNGRWYGIYVVRVLSQSGKTHLTKLVKE